MAKEQDDEDKKASQEPDEDETTEQAEQSPDGDTSSDEAEEEAPTEDVSKEPDDEASDQDTEESKDSAAGSDRAVLTINKETLKIAGITAVVLLAFFLTVAAINNQLAQPTPDTGAFASVNGVNITEEDVSTRTAVLQALGRRAQQGTTLKRQLINEQVLFNEAQRQGLVPDETTVSEELNRLLDESGVNRTRYLEQLGQAGINWSDIKDYYTRGQAINALVNQSTEDINVTEEELRQVYQASQESFEQPRTAEVRHILIASNGENDSVNALADNLVDQLDDGADFCDLVTEYSDDPGSQDRCGRYNVTQDSQFAQPFIDAAFNLSDGDITVVNSSFGAHVIEKLDEREPRTQSFDEVRDQLRDQVTRQQRLNQRSRLVQRLRQNATIKIYDEALREAAQPQLGLGDANTTATDNTTDTSSQNEQEPTNTTTTPPSQNTTTQPGDDQPGQASTELAQCLRDANATLYVVDWSPGSQQQLQELGDAQNGVNVVDCDQNSNKCEAANVSTYPTWELNDDRITGYKTNTSLRNSLAC